MSSKPPDGLPVYRLLTGKDDAAFCRRVSEAIELGYVLYGSPALTFNGEYVVAAQALVAGQLGIKPLAIKKPAVSRHAGSSLFRSMPLTP